MSETRRRAAPLLPPDAGRDRPLFAVAAILVFLAVLSALGAAGAWRAAQGWTAQLSGELTLQVIPATGRDADADALAAAQTARALPGVVSAEARSRRESLALIEPWLGPAALPDDLPVPRLVAVRLDPVAPANPDDVAAAFLDAPYRVVVDDHEQWAEAVARAAGAVRLFALALLGLVAAAAAAVVAFAARASLAARWDVAEALHLVGATDAFTARLFERRFFFLGLKAGIAGALAAALAAGALALAGGGAGAVFFLPALDLGWPIFAIPPAAALVSAVIAALTARGSVRAALRRSWG